MDAAHTSRQEGMIQDSSRVWKIGVIFGTAALGAASTTLASSAAPNWLLAIAIALVICNLGLGFSGPAMTSSVMDEAGKDHVNIGSATLNANRQIGALCSVALMGLLLDMIPDWGLSLRVVFTVFALCMVTALLLIQRGMTAAKPAVPLGEP